MIGFFDSGFGGLTVLKEVEKLLPQYSYLYFGDNLRAPYGIRKQKEIFKFTLQGIEFLFAEGADLIIIACNTSSSLALRKIQREVLPRKYPDKKVLGIIIPTAEDAGKYTQTKNVGVLATPATVEYGAYEKEIRKNWPKVKCFQEACPELVPLIEEGKHGHKNLEKAIEKYSAELLGKSKKIDAVILGCTHYALIENQIRKALPKNVKIISQGKTIAKKLKKYLSHHKEIKKQLDQKGGRKFFTTGEKKKVEKLAKIFYGKAVRFQKISL
jgi:glutamate racemase